MAAVADGMGGYAGGREASQAAIDAVSRATEDDRGSLVDGEADLSGWLRRLCTRANDRVCRSLSECGAEEGGTTLSLAIIAGPTFGVLNVGDSRVYRVGRDVHQLTVDHSVQAEMRASGASYDELVHCPHPHALTRALGEEDAPEPFTRTFPMPESPTSFVLCTDGVHGALTRGELHRLVDDGKDREETTARAIVKRAAEKDGSDNATAAVVSHGPEP